MKFSTQVFLTLLATNVHAEADYRYSEDGSVVIEANSGLEWRRCLEGMQWQGDSCSGEPLKIDQRAALAKWGEAPSKNWRLPNLEELRTITKEYMSPAFDEIAFPNTPAVGVWTSSLYARTTDRAQYIHYANGMSYADYRAEKHAIRLVRNRVNNKAESVRNSDEKRSD